MTGSLLSLEKLTLAKLVTLMGLGHRLDCFVMLGTLAIPEG